MKKSSSLGLFTKFLLAFIFNSLAEVDHLVSSKFDPGMANHLVRIESGSTSVLCLLLGSFSVSGVMLGLVVSYYPCPVKYCSLSVFDYSF